MDDPSFDAVVVGASIAGCTAAVLLAREGLRVALVERHRDPAAHKQLCTHFIQASATPVIRRLGLDRPLERAGAVRNSIEIHTPHGWVGDRLGDGDEAAADAPGHGYNVRRSTLDPMLRELAAATPGVQLMTGWSVHRLIEADGLVAGVETAGGDAPQREARALRARVVVAADGRHSDLARLAGAKVTSAPTRRFGIVAGLRGVDLQRGERSQMWLDGDRAAYVFPNDDGVTVLACMGSRDELDACRDEPLEALKARVRAMPDAPQLAAATPVAEPRVVKDHPNLSRPAVVRGMALVGDAQLSVDYLWGVGCGWAFESAAFLADALAPALRAGQPPAAALAAYERRCRRAFAGHRFLINDYANRTGFNPIERLMFAAAAKDVGMARHLNRFGARFVGPSTFLAPRALLRAMWVNLRRPSAAPDGTRRPLRSSAGQASAGVPAH